MGNGQLCFAPVRPFGTQESSLDQVFLLWEGYSTDNQRKPSLKSHQSLDGFRRGVLNVKALSARNFDDPRSVPRVSSTRSTNRIAGFQHALASIAVRVYKECCPIVYPVCRANGCTRQYQQFTRAVLFSSGVKQKSSETYRISP